MSLRTLCRSRREWPAVAGLLLVALVMHLLSLAGTRVVWGDEPFYLWLGRNWLTGQGYQFLGFTDVHHPPLFPLLAGLLYLLTGSLEIASNILYIVFGSLVILPVYGIGRRLYGPTVGLLAGLLAALWPAFNAAVPWWGSMTEAPFYFFVVLGLWAAAAAAGLDGDARREGSKPAAAATASRPLWAWGLAGLAFGLAYLIRPEGIWYAPAVGGALLVVVWLQRWAWRRWLVGGALFALGFFLAFSPYAIHTRIHSGAWMVSEKVGITFQDALALARGDMAEHDRVLWQLDTTGAQVFFFSPESFHLSMWDQIKANPRRYAGILYLNVQSLLRRFFTVEGFLPVMLPILGLGLFGAAWTQRRARGELLLLAACLPPLTFVLFFIFTRYLSPLLFPMLLWTGLGLARLGDWAAATLVMLCPRLARSGDSSRPAIGLAVTGAAEAQGRPPDGKSAWERWAWRLPVLVVAVILLAAHPLTRASVTGTQAVRQEHRAVGEWLATHTAADAVVMARYPAIAFHADRHWIPSPNSEYGAALRYAAINRADYWVVDGNEKTWRPQLGFLSDGKPPAELELIYSAPTTGRPVYVYRIKP
jgi:4-amino-4-deoxy-L-arabinose transferase-like glycosyltransferase